MALQTVIPVERILRRERRESGVDVAALEAALKLAVRGEVRADAGSRAAYSADASNYRRVPLAVVIPSSVEDVLATIEICRSHRAPIVPRGGGTALAGQTVNEAVVLDFSKRMNRILGVDVHGRTARLELGVVADDLDSVTRPLGLTFGPQPATHSRCCFGGMLANNCGGMRAQRNGTAVNNVEAMNVVLYDGTRMRLGWMYEDDLTAAIRRGGREGDVYARLRALRDRWADRIRTGYPKLARRVSGYNLDQLLPDAEGRFNLARVIVGSEGTLAVMLDATVKLLDDPQHRAVVAIGYDDVFRAGDAVPRFLDLEPTAFEGMDEQLREQIEKKGGHHAKSLELLPKGGGWLLLELAGKDHAEMQAKVDAALARKEGVVDTRVYENGKDQKRVWDAREGGLGATAFVPGEPDAWPGWEDSAVPPEELGSYLRDLRALYDRYDYHPALYGHFGMGVVHCRVPFDLYNEHGISKFRRFLDDAADLVVAHHGSLSGEHGDGQARAELLGKMFGADLVGAMRELKAIFDPQCGLNPGKIVDPYPITDAMRVRQDYDAARFDTHFRFADDAGSFARATMRCVGVGKCRQKHGEGHEDIMCPSYMVTHEEEHSTRGRAHLLFEMVRGDGPIREGWKSEAVKESLDLCLACKGCKGECPVNVDMATYKAEFSSHYWEGRTRPRHMYAFGFIDKWARLAELAPGFANLGTQLPGVRALAKLAAGIDGRAELPPFAAKTFRERFRERGPRVRSEKKAVLWPDTFNDHFHPDTAMAAVDVLEHAGFEVVVPEERVCCGRPLYDFGFLNEARGYLEHALAVTRPYVDARMPIVVLEPSCASVFRDELVDMLPARDDAQSLAASVRLFSELLEDVPLPKLANRPRAIVQRHCHHKSVLKFEAQEKLLEKLGVDAEVLSAGCCGMAGSFGFAKETHDVGAAAGERALLPRVRREPEATIVAADGFSCREQIRQNTSRTALHVAEIAKMAIDAEVPPRASPPEARIALARRRDVRGSMLRAGGAIAIGAALAWIALRRSFR